MIKELEALNKIQHDFGQLKGQELVSCYETIFNALKRLEAIDNAKPSEALECLDRIDKTMRYADCDDDGYKYIEPCKMIDICDEEFDKVKQVLLKQQESKKYLKWEDLEFDHKPKYIDVKMGDNKYLLIVGFSDGGNEMAILQTKLRRYYFVESEDNKQFFNDLRLERVE